MGWMEYFTYGYKGVVVVMIMVVLVVQASLLDPQRRECWNQ